MAPNAAMAAAANLMKKMKRFHIGGLKGIILDREFLFEILGCFSVIWIHFPLTREKET